MSNVALNKLVLYNYFRSSTSHRARIALHYKNLPFEYKPVHLVNNGGEQHSSQYHDLNPAEEVPTLIHGEQVIAQSMAIIQYLDEVFPQFPLFPRNSYLKAKVLQLSEGINCAHALTNLKVQQYLVKNAGVSEAQKLQWVQEWIHHTLQSTEQLLEKSAGTYSFGGEITAADIFLVPQVLSAQRFHVDTTKYPILMRVHENCQKISAFQKAHPFRQIDTPAELKIN